MAKGSVELIFSIDELDLFVEVIESCDRAIEAYPGLPALKEIKEKIDVMKNSKKSIPEVMQKCMKPLFRFDGRAGASIDSDREVIK